MLDNDNWHGILKLKEKKYMTKEIAEELLRVLEIITDHAEETYPHFESERGQVDIARAVKAIAKAKGITYEVQS